MNPARDDDQLEALLAYLKRQRGFDFTGYKRASLGRRIERRMAAVQAETFRDYQDRLEVDPEEFNLLFNTVLINVTAFFRDAPIWEFLAEAIIPALLAAKEGADPIRVWTAGCASGEEAYSAAMLLAEALGTERFNQRVKIYATDLDDEELTRARQATYTQREIAGVPEKLRARYFMLQNGSYNFDRELRRALIFGRHNLLEDAPISRIDLLICRNTLIYFNADVQKQILARFYFALNDVGYLFLGKSETLLTHTSSFTPVDAKRRIFTKVREPNARARLQLMAQAGSGKEVELMADDTELREQAFDQSSHAQIVVDRDGRLVAANEPARLWFRLRPQDLGRPLRDLELSYRPVELRSGVERAYAEEKVVLWGPVEWPNSPLGPLALNVRITPLRDGDGGLLGGSISFEDVTHTLQLEQDLKHTHEELETANEELQSTNEELETTNEELQSSVEELETTNEELQSTNEELETMNEELQSTNEEMQTVNEEMRRRSNELKRSNHVLASILTSLPQAIIVLDHELRVMIWSSLAYELWGLREEEAQGRYFPSLDIGLPVDQLSSALRSSNRGGRPQEIVVDAINRRGRAMRCRVEFTQLTLADGGPDGVILMMEELPSR